MSIRAVLEKREKETLSPHALLSAASRGRVREETPDDIRPAFQVDRDRILPSKAFRRLKHKTQVFLAPAGDHYRTRMTHTLEVTLLARTVARALALNEDLTEAIALGHDLGHTPFGHAGEAVLHEIYPRGFRHAKQSLRVVDYLEGGGQGLNLTYEVREGIVKHSKGRGPILTDDPKVIAATLEGQIARLADLMAYVVHDVDDAVRAGMIRPDEVPAFCRRVLGDDSPTRIDTMIRDMVTATERSEGGRVILSDDVAEALTQQRAFLFARVYEAEPVVGAFRRAKRILRDLYEHFANEPEVFAREAGLAPDQGDDEERTQRICDFLAGMTDQYALSLYERLLLPRPWPLA